MRIRMTSTRSSTTNPQRRCGFTCLCVFCVGPLCGPPLRWWVLCGALPSVWVPVWVPRPVAPRSMCLLGCLSLVHTLPHMVPLVSWRARWSPGWAPTTYLPTFCYLPAYLSSCAQARQILSVGAFYLLAFTKDSFLDSGIVH